MRKLSQKISCKKVNAAKEGIGFCLTESDVLWLLQEAGITVDDWRHDGYHLARFGDSGDYAPGNCRFIPASENYKERIASPKSREASRRNIAVQLESRGAVLRKRMAKEMGKKYGRLNGGQNRLTRDQLAGMFAKVNHLDRGPRFASQAAVVLQCSPKHVRELRHRWVELGLIT